MQLTKMKKLDKNLNRFNKAVIKKALSFFFNCKKLLAFEDHWLIIYLNNFIIELKKKI